MAVGAGLLVGGEGAGGLACARAEFEATASDIRGGLHADFFVRAFGQLCEAAELWFLD